MIGMDEKQIRIMVVDQEVGIRTAFGVVLEHDLKCQIEECSDGEQVLAAVKTFKPHVVVSSFHLPGMTCVDMVKKIREQRSVFLPVVVFAPTISDKEKNELHLVGVDQMMQKPYGPATLTGLVQDALSKVEVREKAVCN